MNREHYFDWAATALPDEDILREALEESLKYGANPSSVHGAGTEARTAFENARKRCAAVLCVKPEQVYFTGGGTEGDQIPLLSLLQRPNHNGTIIISAIEHPAVREQALALKNCGYKIIQVRPDKNGIITAEAVTAALTDDTLLVSVMAVNNETGAIQPIYAIADAITAATKGKRRPKFHVDAVQAFGKTAVNLSHPGIDSAALSTHKICGPRGCGLLYVRDRIEPFLKGGGQEKGLRSGTENLFGALATAACLERYAIRENAPEGSPAHPATVTALTENTARFIESLAALPYVQILPSTREARDDRFSYAVVQASFKNIPGQVMVRALSEKGFYISTGSACSASKNSRPVLEAMGISSEVGQNAVRFSFSSHTTETATSELLAAVTEVAELFNR